MKIRYEYVLGAMLIFLVGFCLGIMTGRDGFRHVKGVQRVNINVKMDTSFNDSIIPIVTIEKDK